MPLQRMEHFLVISEDIASTRDFYCEVLGMTVGFRPELDFPGYWLYVGDVGCLHIAEWETYRAWTDQVGIPMSTRAEGTGPVDHIAFNATDYAGTLATIEARGLPYSCNELGEIGLRQIFVKDPNGVSLELNFRTPHG
jgi:catechol 2,3-dioxygenase-like lactoylglutathione lyase family enzyme